jgi:hypothetical protein
MNLFSSFLSFFRQFFQRNPLNRSPDGTAIKGKSDYLFLYKGFNRYYEMYFDRNETVRSSIEGWITCVDQWDEFVKAKNSEFIFVLVPNKATYLRSLYPLPLPKSGTPYLVSLTKNVDCELFWPRNKDDVFRHNDTHLSPNGNFEFAKFIVDAIGYKVDFNGVSHGDAMEVIGDLGSKFNPPIPEKVHHFSLPEKRPTPTVVFDNSAEYLPERHIGISIHLSNIDAPVQKTLRIFGNSFLGVGNEYSTLWLLGTFFQNVFFEWSPKVRLEELGENEIVIFQTCERFLGYSPDHWQ